MTNNYFFKSESPEILEKILADPIIKKSVKHISQWPNNMLLSFKPDTTQNMNSYINLKYCDVLMPEDKVIRDFSPVPGVDYTPKRLR